MLERMHILRNEVTNSKIVSSLLWSFLQRSGTQGIQLIIMLILARILLPEDFGLIVLVTIFNTIAIVIAQSGFTTALIQKKEIDNLDLSSVFYVNVLSGSILYIFLFFLAPVMGAFFEHQQLSDIIRIISLSLFLGAFNSIQNVIVSRNMKFKELFFSSFLAHSISGIIAIGMAYIDFGVWALVGQQLMSYILNTALLYLRLKWRPQLIFSLSRVKHLFSFGWKVLISSLIDVLYHNTHNLIIGKLFNPAVIGFINRGDQFPGLIVSNLNGSIQSVMLPALSSYQHNPQRVKEMVRRSIVTSSFFIFPMMVGLAIIAEPLVILLLTDKWLPTVPFLQIFCMFYALEPIQTANSQAINALGRSDIYLKLQTLKTLIGIWILLITVQFGIYPIVFGLLINNILSSIIHAYPNIWLLNYSIVEQAKDVFPSFLLSLIMGASIYMVQWMDLSSFSTILVQILLGAGIYIGLAKILKLECYEYLLLTLHRTFENREQNEG